MASILKVTVIEYEKCFTVVQERGGWRQQIIAEDPNLPLAVDHLVKVGVLVGQKSLDENVVYFLNPEKDNQMPHLNTSWNPPKYYDPAERLKRPTIVQQKQERAKLNGKLRSLGVPVA